MKVGSLFAGIGGFDLAAEQAGMEVAWQSEIDPYPSQVLDAHWPDVPNLGDITTIVDPPKVDIITGGFPCQSYSIAGQRGGLDDDRGALWWQMHRIIGTVHPTWVVAENVPGIVSSRGGRDFAVIIDSLVALGYGVAWRILDAQGFNVPQRRQRIFIVGRLGGEPPSEVLDLGESSEGNPEPGRQAGKVVAALTASGLGGGGVDDNLAQAGHLVPVLIRMRSGKPGGGKGALVQSDRSGTLGTSNDQTLVVHATQTPLVTRGHAQPVTANAGQAVLAFAENQRGEVIEKKVAGAITTPGKTMTKLARPQVRKLTPLECERLQGFPDRWTDVGLSDTRRYRAIGNAVCVPVAEWVLRRIAEASPDGEGGV